MKVYSLIVLVFCCVQANEGPKNHHIRDRCKNSSIKTLKKSHKDHITPNSQNAFTSSKYQLNVSHIADSSKSIPQCCVMQ